MFTKLICLVKLKRAVTYVAVTLALSSANAQGEINGAPRGLDHWLTEEQVEAFGLSNLSPEQEKALATWIGDKMVEKAGSEVDLGELLDRSDTAKEFEATVVGEVDGWSGKTVFKLNNGQIWVQRGNERSNKQLSNPSVSVKQNFLGFYVMTFKETGQKVRVKRRQ